MGIVYPHLRSVVKMTDDRHLTIESWHKKQEFYHGEHRGHREKQENCGHYLPTPTVCGEFTFWFWLVQVRVCKRIVSRTDAPGERAAYPSGYGGWEQYECDFCPNVKKRLR